MKIGTETCAGRIRITLQGELDHHTASATLRDTENLLDRYLPRDCILDMSRLSFMDSSGIALILRLKRRMQETGGRIWVENPCPQDKGSKRYEIKQLIATLGEGYPDLKSKVFGAMQRLPMEGWGKENKQA